MLSGRVVLEGPVAVGIGGVSVFFGWVAVYAQWMEYLEGIS